MKTIDLRVCVSDDTVTEDLLQAIAWAFQDASDHCPVLAVAPLETTGFGSTLPNMDRFKVVCATDTGAREAREAIRLAKRGE